MAKNTIGITPANVISVSFQDMMNRITREMTTVIIALMNIETFTLIPSYMIWVSVLSLLRISPVFVSSK
jgi:hypothetical protein